MASQALPLVLLAVAALCSDAFSLPPRATIEGAATALRAQSQTASRPPQATGDSERCSGLAGGLILGLLLAFSASPALAADLENGQGIFLANCAACHAGGNNAVQPDKKLKKEALETYGMFDVERIKYQVTNGKNAMPAFGERLGPEDIEDVANYVIDQANKGWS